MSEGPKMERCPACLRSAAYCRCYTASVLADLLDHEARTEMEDSEHNLRADLTRAQAQIAAADRLAEAAQGVKDAPWSIHAHEDLQAYNRAWFNLEQALTAFREVRRG